MGPINPPTAAEPPPQAALPAEERASDTIVEPTSIQSDASRGVRHRFCTGEVWRWSTRDRRANAPLQGRGAQRTADADLQPGARLLNKFPLTEWTDHRFAEATDNIADWP